MAIAVLFGVFVLGSVIYSSFTFNYQFKKINREYSQKSKEIRESCDGMIVESCVQGGGCYATDCACNYGGFYFYDEEKKEKMKIFEKELNLKKDLGVKNIKVNGIEKVQKDYSCKDCTSIEECRKNKEDKDCRMLENCREIDYRCNKGDCYKIERNYKKGYKCDKEGQKCVRQ